MGLLKANFKPILAYRLCYENGILIIRQGFLCFVQCASFVAGAVLPAVSPAQGEDQHTEQEYFVQQKSNETLFIRINTFEAEFTSVVTGPGGGILVDSGLANNRIAPVFQFVGESREPRQLDIKINSGLNTNRSRFELELTRLSAWDQRSEAIVRAYQLLSLGMQAPGTDSHANWSVKVNSLMNASRIFGQFGMNELRLWSDYLTSHLIFYQLRDHNIVLGMTREIIKEVKTKRFRQIELATLQLRAAALIQARESGSLPVSEPDPVQTALLQTAELAASMGYLFERGVAISRSGADFAARSMYTDALIQFQAAVDIADALGESDLATEVRERIVDIHALQGNAPASSEVLQQIEAQLAEDGASDELAVNLLQQGRLYIQNYDFPTAIGVLLQALAYQNDSAIGKQINFELARAMYETGRFDRSVAYLKAADVDLQSSGFLRTNPIIDFSEGWRILANIYRFKGEFANMSQLRRLQGEFYKSSAAKRGAGYSGYLYEQGLDQRAQAGKRQAAQALFLRAYQVSASLPDFRLRSLFQLHYCAVEGTAENLCASSRIDNAYQALITSGSPKHSAEAMYLRAQMLILKGERAAALSYMDELIDAIHLFRSTLPGVMGAWYWQHNEALFESYLQLSIGATAGQNQGSKNALGSLLALSKIRAIGNFHTVNKALAADILDAGKLKAQLGQRNQLSPGNKVSALVTGIEQELARARVAFGEKFNYLSVAGIQSFLAKLNGQETLLTFHITPRSSHAWVAGNDGVRYFKIANSPGLYSRLRSASRSAGPTGKDSFDTMMDTIGRGLLAPVADRLGKTIYFVPAGLLSGFPLDAVRRNGRYLIEDYQVVNVLSFPANPDLKAALQTGPASNVFLAGYPQAFSGSFATQLNTSTEIQLVADIFVGPGLRIVQGQALLADEFEDERFQQAGLIHLTMPGVIDLANPRLSALELSATATSSGRESFRPADIWPRKLNAELVFLSATRRTGSPDSAFRSQLPIVSGFLDAGAQAVIGSLWATKQAISGDLIGRFYAELQRSGNISEALATSKRQILNANMDASPARWAGFQLFIE